MEIGEKAFEECDSLTHVSIPKGARIASDSFPPTCEVTRY
jgi:hypothetical protein